MIPQNYPAAARAFAGLVRTIPESRWSSPGLGEWDVRALVGHTSRALATVVGYLPMMASREDVGSPWQYYAEFRTGRFATDPAAIVERGRQAGAALGENPADTVDALVEEVLGRLDVVTGDPLIAVIGGLGIRLSTYLATRTFELAVHSLDIAAATEIVFALPDEVLEETTQLAMRIACTLGDGAMVLHALTGRRRLPESFSIV